MVYTKSRKNRLLSIVIPGGIVDTIAHEVLINGEFREIAPPSGGPWGGIGVNKKFIAALANMFGEDFIDHMKTTSPQQWFFLQASLRMQRKILK